MPIVRPAPTAEDDDFDAVELEPNVGFDVDDDFVAAPKPMARAAAAPTPAAGRRRAAGPGGRRA